MITGNINEIRENTYIPEILLKYLLFLQKTDFSKLENGDHILEDGIKLILSNYETKKIEDKKAEAHRKFIDIQYVISGIERIGVGYENSENELLQDYVIEKDGIFYKKVKDESFIIMNEGMFAIFFTCDIHRPGCTFNETASVRKAVIKVPVEMT